MTDTETDNNIRNKKSALAAGAEIISWIFSPLLMPAYGAWIALWGSPLAWLPARIRWYAVIYVLCLTCIIPLAFIGLLRFFKVIKSTALRERTDRGLPYLVALICYAICALHFHQAHAPQWFYMFFAGAGVAILVVAIVNFWWKISAHATAAGGLVAIVMHMILMNIRIYDLTDPLIAVILVAGLTGSTRLLLERHTPGQVWAGYLNGFLCVFIASAII